MSEVAVFPIAPTRSKKKPMPFHAPAAWLPSKTWLAERIQKAEERNSPWLLSSGKLSSRNAKSACRGE